MKTSWKQKVMISFAVIGLSVSVNANAGKIRQWTDPETGVVTFGDAPTDAAAKHILVRPSKGLSMCGDHCQDQANAITIRERSADFRRDKACRRLARHYVGDSVGAELGQAAKEECALNKARAELGLEPVDTGAEAQNAEHFDREGGRRARASDRAIQINEGWQNRMAMDRQTDANQRAIRQQTDAIEDQTEALRRIERNSQHGVPYRHRW